jgi:DNA-binding MarR family transcriptional regulator
MRLHHIPAHAILVAVSDIAEHGLVDQGLVIEQALVEDSLVREWHELLTRYSAVFSTLDSRLQERHGIGANEFEALERLATCDFKCRSADLTEAVHLSQSATSRLVARLEKDGLVERALCEMDRRGIFVTITDAGREKYLAAKRTHREVLDETLGKA